MNMSKKFDCVTWYDNLSESASGREFKSGTSSIDFCFQHFYELANVLVSGVSKWWMEITKYQKVEKYRKRAVFEKGVIWSPTVLTYWSIGI